MSRKSAWPMRRSKGFTSSFRNSFTISSCFLSRAWGIACSLCFIFTSVSLQALIKRSQWSASSSISDGGVELAFPAKGATTFSSARSSLSNSTAKRSTSRTLAFSFSRTPARSRSFATRVAFRRSSLCISRTRPMEALRRYILPRLTPFAAAASSSSSSTVDFQIFSTRTLSRFKDSSLRAYAMTSAWLKKPSLSRSYLSNTASMSFVFLCAKARLNACFFAPVAS
mmetsp:Transcript_66266/g.155990  ORF Transcript_66266/g.155990 Transcript_66266/m.155990 type:complete len:226 (+) Transcript_66266:998-1675(+)